MDKVQPWWPLDPDAPNPYKEGSPLRAMYDATVEAVRKAIERRGQTPPDQINLGA